MGNPFLTLLLSLKYECVFFCRKELPFVFSALGLVLTPSVVEDGLGCGRDRTAVVGWGGAV